MSTLRPFTSADLAWAHALNEAHAVELSSTSPAAFAALLERACTALVVAPEAGFLLAFRQRPAPHSPNFDWLAARCADFVYVDRIVIAPAARGRGLARRLYEALFDGARALGARRIVCEVNVEPPNPASDAFHGALGFRELGRAHLEDRDKTVRYLERVLP